MNTFMNVEDVMKALDVSQSFAYKMIRQLNAELKQKGYITIAGKVSTKYFNEKFYGNTTKENLDARI
jgi:hypothetical protein